MATDPKDALPPRLDPACTCVCHSQPGVMHVAPCCREADPKDAEIARLHQQCEDHDAAWSERVAALTANLRHIIAERDETFALMLARAEKAEADCAQGQRDYCDLKDRHDAHFSAWQSAKLRAEKAEAALAEVREETIRLNKATDADYAKRLSESQALMAAAFEVAARLCDETADEALEESGPASRMISAWFRSQAKAIRALAPADAQAALDARDKAKIEEGRIAGLREAAKIAQSLHDRAATKGQVLNRNTVGKAILAKIKEAEDG